MSYRRADEILPDDILKILQKYVSGETIYVPKIKDSRQRWGSNTGARENLLWKQINFTWEDIKF